MSDKRDYYETLGVAKAASEADIKKAYRKLAMKYHPDRNPDDKTAQKKFQAIQEAYAVLSDQQKRAAYDQFGHAGVAGAAGGAGGAGFGGFDFQDMGDVFGDIFGDIFGGSRRGGGRSRSSSRSRAQRGSDLMYEMALDLEDAVHGVTREITVPTWSSCQTCDGTGAKKGTGETTCDTCKGSGQVQMQHGFIAIAQTCSRCHGTGKIIKNPCTNCRGQGRVQERRKLSVKIPAGVDSGDRIRLSGKGEAGVYGGPAGDLYIEVHVKPHSLFKRQANDLHTNVPIDFITATLGGEVEVPTLDGRVRITIPAETQSGKLFRLRGKGVKALRSGRVGDLICAILVETPVKLNDQQKQHLQQFEQLLKQDGKNHSPSGKTWFDSVKSFFRE